MSDLILPWHAKIREARATPAKDPTCPAAKLGNYADSGNQYLFCGVEGRHFAVKDSPVSVKGWCCGEYTGCPVWQAMKENDPALDRAKAALNQEKQDALTKRHIESGLRVDDTDEREFVDNYVKGSDEE